MGWKCVALATKETDKIWKPLKSQKDFTIMLRAIKEKNALKCQGGNKYFLCLWLQLKKQQRSV